MIALSLETEKNSFLLEMKKEQQTKTISRILEKNHIRNAVICSKEMCFALMGISINDTLLDIIVNDMIQKTVEINNCACSAIISNPLSDYLKLADTYQKLKEGFHIRMIRKQQWQYIFLDELQYDRIMLHISEDTEVHQFIRCKLGPLVEYDRAHDTQLLETLEALIQNHNSRKLAAESLFLHRNTMVHRINKIEEVLHCSLDDTEIMEQLEFAIKMKMYAH